MQCIPLDSIIKSLYFDIPICGTYKEFGRSQIEALHPHSGEGIFPENAANQTYAQS